MPDSPRLVECMATALELACSVEDRDRAEQKDLLHLAAWVDKRRNRLSASPLANPYRLGHERLPCPHAATERHEKDCPGGCRGYGEIPGAGVSRLVELVKETAR